METVPLCWCRCSESVLSACRTRLSTLNTGLHSICLRKSLLTMPLQSVPSPCKHLDISPLAQSSSIWTLHVALLAVPLCVFSSVQFSHSVVSSSLRPHGLQHARPPCPSPTPGVYSELCPLSRGCHPTISSSVVPFSSCPQSFPASGSFQMSQFFPSGGQGIGVSASASVLPMNTQD